MDGGDGSGGASSILILKDDHGPLSCCCHELRATVSTQRAVENVRSGCAEGGALYRGCACALLRGREAAGEAHHSITEGMHGQALLP